jgi:hypothetical protein
MQMGQNNSVVKPARNRRRPTLAKPITIAQWFKNRGGDIVRLELSTYKDGNILSLRTWHTDKTDGITRPGKGFACGIKHLPRLVKEFTKATQRARELGLIDDDEAAE